MREQEEKIAQLKEYFAKRDSVVMAFLFGSQAKGYARNASDWDIAVYLNEENRNQEQEIWTDVEKIVGAEADLVVLNRAPASLAWTIVRAGVVLVVKNRLKYLRFLRRVNHEANAWYRTAREYHRIFERSASLSEEDRRQIERTLQFLEQEVSDYEKFRRLTWKEYTSDRVKKREVERWAEQLINAVVDIAQIVLASNRRVMPETYRLMVRSLGTISPFNKDDICEKLAEWTELRNILAHEYLDYQWKELSKFIGETESIFLALIERVKIFLESMSQREATK